MKKVVIFASGNGSNAENLIQLHHQTHYIVSGIYTNNEKAGIIERSKRLNIPIRIFNKNEWNNVIEELKYIDPFMIVLAGFLWKIPSEFIREFKTIINIHPSLLPKFGGKGMYGMNVHKAVIDEGEAESGITIHRVNENYDEGEILFQEIIKIEPQETPETLARKIHQLEYQYFPKVILNEIEK